MSAPGRKAVLLVRAGGRLCALPLAQVAETMRPLSVSPLSGTEPFVQGATVIRGQPMPVIDLESLLGLPERAQVPSARPERLETRGRRRFVVVRCGPRRAAMAVEAVVGVTELDPEVFESPPLLAGAAGGVVEALGRRDEELLALLEAARIVPDSAWRALDGRGE